MNRGITVYNVISLLIAIIIFTIGNYQIINASTNNKSPDNSNNKDKSKESQDNSNNKDKSKEMPFLLPLTSHSSDQSDNGKKNNFKNDIIPFP